MRTRVFVVVALACAGCSVRGLDGLSRDFHTDVTRPDGPPSAAGNDAGAREVAAAPDLAIADVAPPTLEVRPEAAAPEVLLADAQPPDVKAPEIKDADFPFGGVVVLVVAKIPLEADDDAIAKRLAQRGLSVQPCVDDAIDTCDVSGARLVFLAASALSTKVGATFRTLAKPIIVSDDFLFDDMAMIEDDSDVDPNQHSYDDSGTIEMEDRAGRLAAGLSGTVTIAPAPVRMNWALPPASAQRIAHFPGFPDRAVIFAFPTGASMIGMKAPARRLGFFASEKAAATLTPEGWALFDAAVAWALE